MIISNWKCVTFFFSSETLPELSQPLSSSVKVFHDIRRSWLWGRSILMTIPQSFSITIGYSVRYSFQKGKGETFFPKHTFRASDWPGFTARSRCYIHHMLYPPSVVSTRWPIFSTYSQHKLFSKFCPCC